MDLIARVEDDPFSQHLRGHQPRTVPPVSLTEEVTLIGQAGVSDTTWQNAADSFPDKEIATLLMAIVAINAWNRLAVSTHQALPDTD